MDNARSVRDTSTTAQTMNYLLVETNTTRAVLRADIATVHKGINSQGDTMRRIESNMATAAAIEDVKSLLIQFLSINIPLR